MSNKELTEARHIAQGEDLEWQAKVFHEEMDKLGVPRHDGEDFYSLYGRANLARAALAAQPVAQAPEPMRAHVEQFATRAGWNKDEGEGAFEFVQRKCYHQGWQDGRREALGDVHRDTPEVAMPNPVGARAALAAQPEPAAQDIEDAERWREWLKGASLTVVVPTPTDKNPASKTTIIYGPSPYPSFAAAMNAAVDAARAATKPQGGA